MSGVPVFLHWSCTTSSISREAVKRSCFSTCPLVHEPGTVTCQPAEASDKASDKAAATHAPAFSESRHDPGMQVLGSPIAALLLWMDGLFGLRGWQILFLAEGLPVSATAGVLSEGLPVSATAGVLSEGHQPPASISLTPCAGNGQLSLPAYLELCGKQTHALASALNVDASRPDLHV